MTHFRSASHLQVVRHSKSAQDRTTRLERFRGLLKIDLDDPESFMASIPFSVNDTTVGAENELQTIVKGSKDQVDLALFIRSSNYYKNIQKRSEAGDTPRKLMASLDEYLSENSGDIWENSWVRFPKPVLNPHAQQV